MLQGRQRLVQYTQRRIKALTVDPQPISTGATPSLTWLEFTMTERMCVCELLQDIHSFMCQLQEIKKFMLCQNSLWHAGIHINHDWNKYSALFKVVSKNSAH